MIHKYYEYDRKKKKLQQVELGYEQSKSFLLQVILVNNVSLEQFYGDEEPEEQPKGPVDFSTELLPQLTLSWGLQYSEGTIERLIIVIYY